MKSSNLELVQVQSVATKTRDYYKLSIKNNTTNTIENVILCNPNIRKYCKQNNISLVKYEDQYKYNDVKFEDYKELIGIIDAYVVMDNYKFKYTELD